MSIESVMSCQKIDLTSHRPSPYITVEFSSSFIELEYNRLIRVPNTDELLRIYLDSNSFLDMIKSYVGIKTTYTKALMKNKRKVGEWLLDLEVSPEEFFPKILSAANQYESYLKSKNDRLDKFMSS